MNNQYDLPKLIGLIILVLSIVPLLILSTLHKPILKNKYCFLLVIYSVSIISSLFFSIEPLTSLWGTYSRNNGVIALAFLIFLSYIVSRAKLQKAFFSRFTFLIIFAGLINALFGFLQFFGIDYLNSFKNMESSRSIGLIGGVNSSSGFMAIILVLIISQVLISKKKKYIVFCAVSGIIVLTNLLLSYCRGAWLATFLGSFLIVLFWIISKDINFRKLKILLLFFTFVFSLLLCSASKGFIEQKDYSTPDLNAIKRNGFLARLNSSFNLKDVTIQSRLDFWKTGIKTWLDFPVFGAGQETFKFFYSKNRKPSEALKFGTRSMAENPHNIILETLIYRGLFGLFSLLLLLCFTSKNVFSYILFKDSESSRKKIVFTAFSMWLTAWIFTLTNVHNIAGNILIWFIGGLLWNPGIIKSSEKEKALNLFSGNKQLCLLIFLLPLLFYLNVYFLKSIVADSVLKKALNNDPTEIEKRIFLFNKANELFSLEREYDHFLVCYLNSLPIKYLKENNLITEIEKICKKRIEWYPNDHRFIYQRAIVHLQNYDINRQKKYLQKAEDEINGVMENVKYHLEIEKISVEISLKKDEKRKALEKINRLSSWVSFEYLRKRKSEQIIKNEVEKDCDILVYLNRIKGFLLASYGKEKEAEIIFEKLLEVDSSDALTWYNLGVLKAGEQLYEEATFCFEKSINIDPGNSDAIENLAYVRELKK